MNKQEKVRRRAIDAMVQLLTMTEQPKDNEQTIVFMHFWEKKSFDELVDAFYLALKSKPLPNTGMIWYVKVCLDEVEALKTGEKQRELVSV